MAGSTIYRGKDMALTVQGADSTGEAYQLKDFGAVEIGSANKGVFWKVNSVSFTPTQNTSDRPHVGTTEIETIATTKDFEVTVDMDWYFESADITLADGATTYHAVTPKSVLKQLIEGDGDTYDLTLHMGCDLTSTVDGEAFATPSTSDFDVVMTECILLSGPESISAGEVASTTWTFKVKSATIA